MIYNQVSIVIPTYNRADYLVECIISCLNQTHPCEIIVCDHGSTDDTPIRVKQFEGKIKYVRRELDSGVHFCWLDGILHASHDLIHINFDDDWIEPTFIEKCMALFGDDVGCVLSEARVYYEVEKNYGQNVFNLNSTTGKYPTRNLIKKNLVSLTSPSAGIYRKKVMLDCLFVGQIPFSKNEYRGVGSDVLFTLMSCLLYPRYGFVVEPLAIFRSHDSSISVDASKDIAKKNKIENAYKDAKVYYFIVDMVDRLMLYNVAKWILIYKTFNLSKLKKYFGRIIPIYNKI